MKITYEQRERDLLIAALLDITLEEFFDPAHGEAIDKLEPGDPVNVLGGSYVEMLKAASDGNPDAPQAMYQVLATMGDLTMHRFLNVYGRNPLDFDPSSFTE